LKTKPTKSVLPTEQTRDSRSKLCRTRCPQCAIAVYDQSSHNTLYTNFVDKLRPLQLIGAGVTPAAGGGKQYRL